MRKFLFTHALTLLLLLAATVGFAQNMDVRGRVLDESGNPVAGATVTVRGTNAATSTNETGNYTISARRGATLVFSFVGFATRNEVVSGPELNVTFSASSAALNEVVVTALGVERNRRSLSASVTTVGGENFTQAREISAANALAGRVAGVNVTRVASGAGGSSRVVIRGAKTLGSTLNQPLYVVDGVPIDNTSGAQAGMWGGADQGDAMNSINPDDIASMTVLKGAAAAALYGSRAANGVILITTKKGSGRRGLGVEFNSNYVIESVQNLTDFQTSHGSGGMVSPAGVPGLQNQFAKKPESIQEAFNNNWNQQAWGPRLDGTETVQFDGKTRPYSDAGDNWKRFYQLGHQLTNTIALTGGSETQSFRLSLSDLRSKGNFPNSGFDRFNATLTANSKIGNKITMNAKVLYSNENTKNRPRLSDAPGNANLALYYTPADVNINDMIGDPNKPGAVPSVAMQQEMGIVIRDQKNPGEEFQSSGNIFQNNPWWSSYQYRNFDTRDRVIANGEVRYNITDFLYLSGQGGMDLWTLKNTQLTPQGTGHNRGGAMSEQQQTVREVNLQYMLGFDKTLAKRFRVNAFFGGNVMRKSSESISANATGFSIPFLAAVNNGRIRNFGYGYGKRGINSLFASAEVSYNNYLFLTGTARKDWFSTLNPQKNSILYPSVGASFVFTDAIKTLPTWVSFGKARIAWAQVGNTESVGAYQTVVTYGLNNNHLGAPLGGFSGGNNLRNEFLVPFTSTELEYGIELRVFKNRLGLDITYYDQKTTNDILNAGISQSSGFGSTSVNLGKITNKGIEFLLTATPVRSAVTWDVSLNFAKNKSRVVELAVGQKRLGVDVARTETAGITHIVGYPYGMITGPMQLRDSASGALVYDSSGTPQLDATSRILGTGVPDFTGGLNNSITWKGVNLAFLIDFRAGGDIYSGTNLRMTQAGFTKQSLQGRAGEAPLTITGVVADRLAGGVLKPFTKTLTPGEARNYWNQLGIRAHENFVYDASFVKLRQITLGYTLPAKLFNNTPIRNLMISLVARNLAILYKNVPNIDPESAYSAGNGQGLDYFGMPSSRTYGINVRATF
jgi:TonB-linked SusC/RagA family outer membrane protein